MTPKLSDGDAVVRALDVSVSFGGVRVLSDVSISVPRAQVIGLIGPNGAGKSTLLKVIAGLVPPGAGRVIVGDRDVTSASVSARCRDGLALTFQTPRYVTNMTVGEQLLVSLRSYRRFARGVKRAAWQAQMGDIIEEYELLPILEKIPTELTLGEIRRFEIARALLTQPSVLLVDEPASGMSADDVVLLARQLRHVSQTGVAVLLVEHNVPFVREVASAMYVLDQGQIIAEGEPHDVLARDVVAAAYLGTQRA